jgi:hypothetical protein
MLLELGGIENIRIQSVICLLYLFDLPLILTA